MTGWQTATKEQVEAYNARRRAKYAEEQAKTAHQPKWKSSIYRTEETTVKKGRRKSVEDQARHNMLRDFLVATTPEEKRKVIESFAPHYFVFGNKLDPRNPYEENEDEQL